MQVRQPYREFLERLPAFGGWENTTRQRAVVLVDNRDDPLIGKVISSYQRHLGEAWNFHHVKPKGTFGPTEFNQMLLSPSFWNRFQEDLLLIIQGDTVCLRPLAPSFEQYAMIGAPCGEASMAFAMNGGLSLRHRQAMTAAISAQATGQEDVFFTSALRRRGVPLPRFETACAFSVESECYYVAPPFGVHGTDKLYHTNTLARQMVADSLREYPWS